MAVRANVECCVVQGSYRSRSGEDGPETVVELWCRAREGHSVLLLVHGMRPYLEIAVPGRPTAELPEDIEQRLERVRQTNGVTRVHEPQEKWTELGTKPHWRVEIKQPWAMTTGPRVREKLEADWETTSADIVFVNRLFYDNDVGPHIRDTHRGDEARTESAERVRESGGEGLYPVDLIVSCNLTQITQCEAFPAPFVLFSFDLETSIAEETILCAAAVVQRGDERTEHTFRGSEREILEGLTRLVRETDPDIITGYNVDNFDLPRIESRMKALAQGTDIQAAAELFGWGRVPILDADGGRLLPKRDTARRTWRLHGRCVLDAWWQARMTLRPQRETLRFVAELLWPERDDLHKLDVDASKMDEEWAKDPDLVLEYCLRDAILPLEILSHIHAVERKEALAAVARVPLEVGGATSTRWKRACNRGSPCSTSSRCTRRS